MITITDIETAARRIAPYAKQTPVMTSATLDDHAGRALFFKCENFQKVGAFKFRGACNAVLQIPADKRPAGVVTHSSGNHAQGLAAAAKMCAAPAHIVMPSNAPAVKKAAVAGYGATIYECEPTLPAREETAARVQAETGATFVPPYDHPHIIAGQGTAALELIAECPDLDAIITPVGGGGLLSGTCIVAANSNVRVFAAEPAGADDAARSLAAGERIMQTAPNTIADGLLTSLGEITWPIIRDHAEQIITVTDDEIRAALRLVWERMKIIIEPSAAVTVAAVLKEEFRNVAGLKKVGIILSGGNLDLTRCSDLFANQ